MRCSSACSVQVNAIAAASSGTAGNIHHASDRATSRSPRSIRATSTAMPRRAYQGIIRFMARQAATDTPDVSVIVLVYNEVDSVEPLHRELMGVMEALGPTFEVLYIDDGSRDGSTERLGQLASRDARVRVVSFRRNFGQTAAVQAGIDNSRGDILVFLDGDMQNDPHDIPHLLAKIDEGYDVVSGWRRNRHDAATRVLPSQIANWLIGRVTGVRLSDFGCTLKAYRREVIEDVRLY